MSVTDCRPCYSASARVAYLTRGGRAALTSCPYRSLGEFVDECGGVSASKGRKVEALSIVQSFSPDELDRRSADDVRACHFAGQLLAEELYPGVPVLVVTHTDGDGGCLHNHLLVVNDGADGRALSARLRSHRTVSRANDAVMRSLSLSVIGDEAETWAQKRESIPEGAFERELGDAVCAALSEGGVYSVGTFRDALARHGVHLEEVPLKERGADGRKRVVTDGAGRPVVAGWRYAKRYSGDEGTPRKAMRRRRASNLCAEFTRESILEAFEAELARISEKRRGTAPVRLQQGTYDRKESDQMKQGTTKRLTARRQEQPAEPTMLKEAREPGETWPDGEDMPPLDRKAVMDDLVALQGHPGYLATARQEAPAWKGEAESIHPKGSPTYSPAAFDAQLRQLHTLAQREVESAREKFRGDKEERDALASQGRTVQEWALGHMAGRYHGSLVGILALVMQARLQLCREERKRDSRKALYRSRAAMWDAEKRARAIEQAMLIYRHSEKGTPEYRQARREQAEREIEAYANSITEKQRYRSELSL